MKKTVYLIWKIEILILIISIGMTISSFFIFPLKGKNYEININLWLENYKMILDNDNKVKLINTKNNSEKVIVTKILEIDYDYIGIITKGENKFENIKKEYFYIDSKKEKIYFLISPKKIKEKFGENILSELVNARGYILLNGNNGLTGKEEIEKVIIRIVTIIILQNIFLFLYIMYLKSIYRFKRNNKNEID